MAKSSIRPTMQATEDSSANASVAEKQSRKPIVWLAERPKIPPFTEGGKSETGHRLLDLQDGIMLGMPTSKQRTDIGPRCHQLRIQDESHNWRITYRVDPDAVVVADIYPKTTQKTEKPDVVRAQKRLAEYDDFKRQLAKKTARQDAQKRGGNQ